MNKRKHFNWENDSLALGVKAGWRSFVLPWALHNQHPMAKSFPQASGRTAIQVFNSLLGPCKNWVDADQENESPASCGCAWPRRSRPKNPCSNLHRPHCLSLHWPLWALSSWQTCKSWWKTRTGAKQLSLANAIPQCAAAGLQQSIKQRNHLRIYTLINAIRATGSSQRMAGGSYKCGMSKCMHLEVNSP